MLESILKKIETQFKAEEHLLDNFESLNSRIRSSFDGVGLRGLTQGDINTIGEMTLAVERTLNEIHQNREVLLNDTIRRTDSPYNDISDVLNEKSSEKAAGLKLRWMELMDRATRARAELLSNQMTLLYSVEFCQRFIAGLVDFSEPNDRYGQSTKHQGRLSGNLVRKNC